MKTELEIKNMLERIEAWDKIIQSGVEALKKRNELRLEMSKLMIIYAETVNETFGEGN